MALSKPLNLKKLYEITSDNTVLLDFLCSNNILLSFNGQCDRCADGQLHLVHDSLIPIIKRWILPGTTILSDCWKAYSSLEREGFIHNTVNHSLQFVTDAGTHTNNTESRWNASKKTLPRYVTSKPLYNSYFAEYCIRKNS